KYGASIVNVCIVRKYPHGPYAFKIFEFNVTESPAMTFFDGMISRVVEFVNTQTALLPNLISESWKISEQDVPKLVFIWLLNFTIIFVASKLNVVDKIEAV